MWHLALFYSLASVSKEGMCVFRIHVSDRALRLLCVHLHLTVGIWPYSSVPLSRTCASHSQTALQPYIKLIQTQIFAFFFLGWGIRGRCEESCKPGAKKNILSVSLPPCHIPCFLQTQCARMNYQVLTLKSNNKIELCSLIEQMQVLILVNDRVLFVY